MADEKALRHAFMRFRGFRSHVYGTITVAMVDEYHTILIALQEASKEDLSALFIPRSMMHAHVVSPDPGSASRYEPELTHATIATRNSSRNDWSGFGSASAALKLAATLEAVR
jgi:hypothetical protein